MTIKISCDTIARLANLLPHPDADVEPIFHTMRLDRGCIIATDRSFGAAEVIEPFEGSWHIRVPEALINQCKIEAEYNGVLTVTPNKLLGWTAAQTTMGFVCPENIGMFVDDESPFSDWYARMVQPALQPAEKPSGSLVCHAEELARLGKSSPSGWIVFEQNIDTMRTSVLRDIHDHRWVGFFHPRRNDGLFHPPASVPTWLKG